MALYIREANFTNDTWPLRAIFTGPIPDHSWGPLATLLADSPYLREAGLNWKEYCAVIKEELDTRPCYSQHAAIFLLTLLPNLKTLKLPRLWKPTDKTKKLLDVIVHESRQSYFPRGKSSLAQVTEFQSLASFNNIHGYRFELKNAIPFLALPNVRSFLGLVCVARCETSMALVLKNPVLRCSDTLEAVKFLACSIDEVAIADFLRYTPRLRILKYTHMIFQDDDCKEWDICKFLAAIEREAGSHLEELYLYSDQGPVAIAPGRVSMNGFKRLRKLDLPLEIVMCNMNQAISGLGTPDEGFTNLGLNKFGPLIGDLIPGSVFQLTLVSIETDHNAKALEVLVHGFAAKKASQLPALKDIYLRCRFGPSSSDAYNEQCAKLLTETGKAGVVLHVVYWEY